MEKKKWGVISTPEEYAKFVMDKHATNLIFSRQIDDMKVPAARTLVITSALIDITHTLDVLAIVFNWLEDNEQKTEIVEAEIDYYKKAKTFLENL